jgi:hypothetical protein
MSLIYFFVYSTLGTTMSEQPNLSTEEAIKLAQSKIDTATQAETEIHEKAHVTVNALRSMWSNFLTAVSEQLELTDEQKVILWKESEQLQSASYNTSYNAVQFAEMYNYHVNHTGELDVGARFIMDDLIRGMLNHASGIPVDYLNIVDETYVGYDDPRYGKVELPVEKLTADPNGMKIPVRVETLDSFAIGYLEMFRFQKQVGDKLVTFVTTYPAIRTKANYITLNSVYRWFETTDEDVKNCWLHGKHLIAKKRANGIAKPDTKGTAPNETQESNSDNQPDERVDVNTDQENN